MLRLRDTLARFWSPQDHKEMVENRMAVGAAVVGVVVAILSLALRVVAGDGQ